MIVHHFCCPVFIYVSLIISVIRSFCHLMFEDLLKGFANMILKYQNLFEITLFFRLFCFIMPSINYLC